MQNMMSSRERVGLALSHKEADRVPLDLGGSTGTGMHVDSVYLLRQALGLDPPGTPVKVIEPFQMLGEIAPDLIAALGVDVVGLQKPATIFGFRNEGWKPWSTFAGTPVLVPEGFNTVPDANGDILLYPQGDPAAAPSGRMPKSGLYFDLIARQGAGDDNELSVEDFLEGVGPISDQDLAYLKQEAERLYTTTDKAILADFGGTSFGSYTLTLGPAMKHPKGMRSFEEWQMSTITRPDSILRVLERQCEIGLANLERIAQAVGDRVIAVMTSFADYGMQTGPFVSPKTYRTLYKPFNKAVNGRVHEHTPWKTFMHCCGSVRDLLEDFIEAGFDILNPVQTSAARMDPVELKKTFGERLTFWGGGVDTQRTLPFGTPDMVRQEVRERIRTFGAGGGFVFNPIHNVQAGTPVENLLAMYEAVREYGRYPV
jgi:hypothetical protein